MTEQVPMVFVVEDEGSVREALDSLLRSAGYGVRLFNSAGEFLSSWTPDDLGCLVLDVQLPGLSGLALQQELIKADIQIPTIFITGHGDIRMSVQAIKSGAVEFLTKPVNHLDLLNAVRNSMDKAQAQFKEKSELVSLRRRYEALTSREREVMKMVISGMLNKQVAAEIGISEITVKIHRGNAMHKMGASSLADLVRMAERIITATHETK
ncbi:response regulator transcription factor [Acidicapsa acidisoli]|uniref:response regulator transcription factor n=1 Tax=Acidicapsa acidisoli TaxID=1615681 RepID=UPI0021E01073|nr:response regulator [Acidicapsa acidisoli]